MVARTSVLESIESLARNLHSAEQRKYQGSCLVMLCNCRGRTRPKRSNIAIFPEVSLQSRQASSPAASHAPLGHCLGAIVHVKFKENSVEQLVHNGETQAEFVGDFFVKQSFRQT